MWPIIKITYREMISKRIFTITVLMSLAFLLLFGVATWFAAREIRETMGAASGDAMMMKGFFSTQLLGMGLYFGSIIAALLAILSSVGSIASEIESHQIDTWLARAMPRRQYMLGKFLGLASMLILYTAMLYLGLIAINQWVGGGEMAVQLRATQVMTGLGYFLLLPVILVCVSLLMSSMTTTVTGGIFLIILYGISFIGGFVEQLGSLIHQESLVQIGIVSSLIFPTDSLFRLSMLSLFEAVDNPLSFASQGIFGTSSPPSAAMLYYTLGYGLVALLIAIRIFQRRDV
ncbi:ABC transporter permease [Brevibacillus panacihumi]|uniref:ABC transporter permease n=1 Tax=Brevibacillus panacihumi TaxID=497735 RepID=UPI003D040ED7